MIIEGRHADVGSGIFISDIQPESVAEQVRIFIVCFFFDRKQTLLCVLRRNRLDFPSVT